MCKTVARSFSMVQANGIPTLSSKEAVILRLLIAHGELFGLALVAASDGALKRGTVYVTLDRMEDKGFIVSHLEARPSGEFGIAKRVYRITGLGQRVLAAHEAASLVFAGGVS